MSEEFSVNISLRQVSSLSPLTFIIAMELVSRKVNMRVILDVAVESRRKMQKVLGEWKKAFGKHRLKWSVEKTEVMWVGKH